MLPQDALLVPLSLEEALMVQSVLVLAPRLRCSMFYFTTKEFIGIIIRALEEMKVISIHSCSNSNWICRILLRKSLAIGYQGQND